MTMLSELADFGNPHSKQVRVVCQNCGCDVWIEVDIETNATLYHGHIEYVIDRVKGINSNKVYKTVFKCEAQHDANHAPSK